MLSGYIVKTKYFGQRSLLYSFLFISLLQPIYSQSLAELMAGGLTPDLTCPAGYTNASQLTGTGGGTSWALNLKCVRNEVADYNSVVNEIVNAITKHYTANHNATRLTLSDLLGFTPWGHITPADLNKVRQLVVNANPASDTDILLFDLAARLGPRVAPSLDASGNLKGGYREYANNALHPGVCAPGYVQGSFFSETQPSWNAEPGDGLVTRNMNHPLAELFKSTNIVFTHSGMATGPYGVRHNTAYQEFFLGHILGEDSLGADKRIDSQYLYQSLPGTITENLDGTFCKDLATCDPTQQNTANNENREFDGTNTLLLTTSNSSTRSRLRQALNWAQNTNLSYSVYGFSDGTYQSGHNVCSTFVRDALLSEYSPAEFNVSITTNPPYLAWAALGLTTPVTALGSGTLPAPSQILQRTYNTDYKAFWYPALLRASGAQTLYEHIFSQAKAVAANGVVDYINGKVNGETDPFWIKFWRGFWVKLTSGIPPKVAENIGMQMVNCFAFNDCGNYTVPPSNSFDTTHMYSPDDWKPQWPVSAFNSGTRPAKEGWAFSADDLLYVSNPYDRFEKLVRIDGELVNSEYCTSNPVTCISMVSQMCNQTTGQDMLTKGTCAPEADLLACKPTSLCSCDHGVSCSCAATQPDWVDMNAGIQQTTHSYQIEFTNDSLDPKLGNDGCDRNNPATCTSIAGAPHGPFYFPVYTAQIKQILNFIPYNDSRDYSSFVEAYNPIIPVSFRQATSDKYKNSIQPIPVSVLPGDRVRVILVIVYGWDTQVGWSIEVNSVIVKNLVYTLPHLYFRATESTPLIDHNYTASLYRAHELVIAPWEYR